MAQLQATSSKHTHVLCCDLGVPLPHWQFEIPVQQSLNLPWSCREPGNRIFNQFVQDLRFFFLNCHGFLHVHVNKSLNQHCCFTNLSTREKTKSPAKPNNHQSARCFSGSRAQEQHNLQRGVKMILRSGLCETKIVAPRCELRMTQLSRSQHFEVCTDAFS